VNVDIFIRSYYKDFQWLRYCLRSIEKYSRGFRKTILVVPRSSAERLAWFGLDQRVETHICDNFADDYLGQQVTKLHADTYTDADFICHVDSDCVFRRKITPHDLVCGGKAIIPITSYRACPEEVGWQRLSERFLSRPVEYDFMRRQPLVFPRWLYAAIRIQTERLHKKSLHDYVNSQPARGFSEYNALGGFAYYNHFDGFIWRERCEWVPDESFCRWYWSWGGISASIRTEMDAILS
jgi:uncharacterized protein DUF6492